MMEKRFLLGSLLLAVLYLITAGVAQQVGSWIGLGVPLWPATGLCLGAVLLYGAKRCWLGIFLGSLASNLLFLNSSAGAPGLTLPAALCIAAAETAEPLFAAFLVRTFAEGRNALLRPRSICLFVVYGALLATWISPGMRTAIFFLSHGHTGLHPAMLGSFWLGSVLGVLVLTSLILAWGVGRIRGDKPERANELIALLLAFLGICVLVFGGWVLPEDKGLPVAFLLIPLLLLAARRFGHRGALTAVFILVCASIMGTGLGFGPFSSGDPAHSLFLLQTFTIVAIFTTLILAADNVHRRRAENELRASEQRYRALFEKNPQAMWVYDCETLRFLAVNQAAVERYGYTREEFLTMRVDDVRLLANNGSGGFAEVDSFPSLWQHRRKDGGLLDVEVSRFQLSFDERPAALILSIDVTERKHAEARAAAFSEIGRRLSGVRTAREAGHIILEAAEDLFGWDACMFDLRAQDNREMSTIISMDTVNGKRVELPPHPSHLGPITRLTMAQGAQLILRPPGAQLSPEAIPFGDRSRASASIMSVPVRKDNEAIGFLSIQSYQPNAYDQKDLAALQSLADHCSGALDRIRAEDALEQSREQMRQIADALPVLMAQIDADERYQFTNLAYESWVGKTRTELRGRTIRDIMGNREYERIQQPIREALEGIPQHFELEWTGPDQGPRTVDINYIPQFSPRGEVEGFYLLASDVTERKAAEREILTLNSELERRVRERTAQLESINKELEAFSYSVSHDLRAPLRSIRGFSEVLLERYAGQLDTRGQEFLRRACESSQHMDKLIEDLLKLSRVTRSELQRQTVNLSALAEAIISDLRKAEPERRVEAVIEPDLYAQGDERLLRIVLENLLRNAWKFTIRKDPARIEVGCMRDATAAFFVRDNGAGFDMKFSAKLFGVFQRLHTNSEFPGTGVGLATVQRIVNRHGGKVWANAAVNQGATFFFTLPGREDL